eukprot:CAMPEP_0170611090 /NCGR_PEP_ID=MMETSP0224-20130122/23006_1 /TAXON_ID=285029 /ORGANISM="Togula jolla, Strain CCCM 725" /LENGTH=295 /DNA_ID=CAMNT_0010936507 /DNA_START=25 /DNA_END=912 /DNA_ORIENTATION=+
MNLNEIHTAQAARFLSFFKGRTTRSVSEGDAAKANFAGDYLSDEERIYNKSDVEAILGAYHTQMMAFLREQLENSANLSAVYTCQLFAQAEQAGMSLQVDDISFVEDQSRLNQLSGLAALQGAPPLAPKPKATLPTLGSGGGGTADPAMLQELSDVKEDNRQMKDRYQLMQTELSGLLRERSTLNGELEKVKSNFKQLLTKMHETNPDSAASQNVAEIERALLETQATLSVKAAECDSMRKDLTQRLGDSSQFRDLKAIVKRKSDEIKELKALLTAHGFQLPASNEGVELQADSD